MAKSKLVKANEKIAENVKAGLSKISDAVVNGYTKIEDAVVGSYTKIEDVFVERYLIKEGETLEQAKKRLKQESGQGEKKR